MALELWWSRLRGLRSQELTPERSKGLVVEVEDGSAEVEEVSEIFRMHVLGTPSSVRSPAMPL
jgi:hypothetical protein